MKRFPRAVAKVCGHSNEDFVANAVSVRHLPCQTRETSSAVQVVHTAVEVPRIQDAVSLHRHSGRHGRRATESADVPESSSDCGCTQFTDEGVDVPMVATEDSVGAVSAVH